MNKENIFEDIETKLAALEKVVESLKKEVNTLEEEKKQKENHLTNLVKEYNQLKNDNS